MLLNLSLKLKFTLLMLPRHLLLFLCLIGSNVYGGDKKKEDIEVIKVTAQYGDAALKAFNSGDFALAEQKFMENAKCALRRERDMQSFVDGVQNSQVTTEVNGGGINTGSSITDSNASRIEGNSSLGISSKKTLKNKDYARETTCENRGFQIYMAGMSQLQLGRTEDAEESFKRATNLSQNQYDAHHRLALMKLLRQDNEGAKFHLKSIKSMLKRCYKCDARNEILMRIAFLEKALKGEIKLQ